jgi:hypothetical protein
MADSRRTSAVVVALVALAGGCESSGLSTPAGAAHAVICTDGYQYGACIPSSSRCAGTGFGGYPPGSFGPTSWQGGCAVGQQCCFLACNFGGDDTGRCLPLDVGCSAPASPHDGCQAGLVCCANTTVEGFSPAVRETGAYRLRPRPRARRDHDHATTGHADCRRPACVSHDLSAELPLMARAPRVLKKSLWTAAKLWGTTIV